MVPFSLLFVGIVKGSKALLMVQRRRSLSKFFGGQHCGREKVGRCPIILTWHKCSQDKHVT